MNLVPLGWLSLCGVVSGFGGFSPYNPETQCDTKALAAEPTVKNEVPVMPQHTCSTDRIYPSPDGSCACTDGSETAGTTGDDFSRILPASFSDKKLPNARAVSNAFWSSNPVYQEYGVHQNMLVLAAIQYGVHDFSDSRNHKDEPQREIPIPMDDPVLAARGEYLSVSKTIINKTDYTIPNFGSHWLDQAGIYGNDLETQRKLREPDSAKLKTDASGQFLPTEKETGVKMEGPTCAKSTQTFFAAGSRLANMNHLMLLTTTLFLRNHNSWVDTLLEWAPELAAWSNDDLFGLVRHISTMQLEKIVNEYIDSYLGGQTELKNKMVANLLKGLDHCNANTKCQAPIEFSMVYRWHDFIVPKLSYENTTIDFVATAYSPDQFREPGYLDTLVRAALNTRMTRSGSGVIDSLRTMEHGEAIWDLAALGVARSRERGIPSYTAYRQCFGYDPINSFEEMSSDPEVVDKLKALYESPDDVDLLVGIEIEGYEPGLMPHPPFIGLMLTLAPLKRLNQHYKFSADSVLNKKYPNLLIHATSKIDTDSGDLFTRIMDTVVGTTLKAVLVGTTNVGADEIPDEAMLIPNSEPVPTEFNVRPPSWLGTNKLD